MIKKILQSPWLYTILIGLIFILPFMVIAYYTYPTADDLCRVQLLNGYWSSLYDWYIKLNGRFLNAIIVFFPVYNFKFYWLLAILFMWIFAASTHYMLKQAMAPLGWSKNHIMLMSTAFLAFLMVKLPAHNEFFYWYAASTAYVLGLSLNMLMIGGVLKMNANPSWKSIRLPAIAAFLAIGCHEMSMAHAVGFLLAALFLSLFFAEKRKILLPKLMLVNLVAWVAAAICILAPGNNNRLNESPGTRDIEHSLNLAWSKSFQYIVDYFLAQPLFLLSVSTLLLLMFISLSQANKSIKYPALNPILGLFYTYAVVFVLIFLVGYSVHYFIPDYGRISNMVWGFTAILFLLNTINLAYWLHNKLPDFFSQGIKIAKGVVAILSISIVYLGINTPNYFTVWDDLYSGRAAKYVQEFEERLSYLDKRFSEETHQLILVDAFTDPPKTTFFMDITDNWDTWENYCFCSTFDHFYGKGALFMLALKSKPKPIVPLKVFDKLVPTPDSPPMDIELHPSLLSGKPPKVISIAKGVSNPLLKKLDKVWKRVAELVVEKKGIAVYYDAKQHILVYKIKTITTGWENQQFFLELSSTDTTKNQTIQRHDFILNGEKTFGSKLSGDYFYYVRALPDYPIQMIKTGLYSTNQKDSSDLWKKELILIK